MSNFNNISEFFSLQSHQSTPTRFIDGSLVRRCRTQHNALLYIICLQTANLLSFIFVIKVEKSIVFTHALDIYHHIIPFIYVRIQQRIISLTLIFFNL